MNQTDKRTIKCAVYTRKSSEEGLEQDFNSLDAQREACESYIKSQMHEGWVLVEKQYNDGGFSGGTLERPAVKELFKDIEEGKVDTVVVYKVDRLTRSLMDFAKIVELFDKHNASFVSITQHFNTTTSMGRLTLNVLLSFAQFEREVTGERIRDKFAASKKKGMWINGVAPIGYLKENNTLKIDKKYAPTITLIFEKYLELKTVIKLKEYLLQNQILTKSGKYFSKGHLYNILSSQTYTGKIKHKEELYEGLHDGIIDQETFDKVQAQLKENCINKKNSIGSNNPSLLAGKLFDDKNNYMSPSHSNTRNRKYRYYVSQALIQSRKNEAGSISKIPAGEIEALVTNEIKSFLSDKTKLQKYLENLKLDKQKDLLSAAKELYKSKINNIHIRALINKIVIYKQKVEITICKNQLLKILESIAYNTPLPENLKAETKEPIVITKNIKISLTSKNGSVLIISDSENKEINFNTQMINAIAKSFYWNKLLLSSEARIIEDIQKLENLKSKTYVGNVLQLKFLAPDIIEKILNGKNPKDLTIENLFNIKTLNWAKQRKALNL